jgi:hypothetical protein
VVDGCQQCCDECGVEITWTPVMIDGRPYCCHDCAVGLECDCASTEPRWRDDAGLFLMGGIEGSVESSYSIDYGFD